MKVPSLFCQRIALMSVLLDYDTSDILLRNGTVACDEMREKSEEPWLIKSLPKKIPPMCTVFIP